MDPQMQTLLDQLTRAGMPPNFPVIGAAAAREMAARGAGMLGAGPAMSVVTDHQVDGAGGPLPGRLYVPTVNPKGLIVFYHGGGWVLGDIAGYEAAVRRLAAASHCAVLAVEYRLAPENQFPQPLEDCYEALIWADTNRENLLNKTVPLIVAGDSAGGNLAAVVALLARDRRGPSIAAQLLIFPVTNADFSTSSYQEFASGYMLSARDMQWFWDQYIPDPAGRANPMASPLRANSLANLPYAIIETAWYDPLRDEGELYAQRLQAAGVGVALRCWEGLCHGFFQFGAILEPAGLAIDEMGKTLLTRL